MNEILQFIQSVFFSFENSHFNDKKSHVITKFSKKQ